MHSHSNLTTLKAARELWERCFQDDEQFTDFYFSHRYSDDIHMAIYRDEQMIAGLQMIPYVLHWRGQLVESAYISGACTHPDFRKQGVMPQLLEATHRRMYEQGVGVSTLIPAEPWLFDYYATSGYVPLFQYQHEQVQVASLLPAVTIEVERIEQLSTAHYTFVDNAMRQRSCSLLHSQKDLMEVVEAYLLNGGAIWVATSASVICGVAFVENLNGAIVVKELLTSYSQQFAASLVVESLSGKEMGALSSPDSMGYDGVATALLRAASTYFKVTELSWYRPIVTERSDVSQLASTAGSSIEVISHPLGMIRIIHLFQLLCCYAQLHPMLKAYICLEGDAALPMNNGYYTLEGGVCEKKRIPQCSYEVYDLYSLTRLIFAAESPYMTLMLD